MNIDRLSENWYFVTKIVLTYCEKKKYSSSDREKLFEITRTIYSSSERSEQFLLMDFFFNLYYWDIRNMQEKMESIIEELHYYQEIFYTNLIPVA